MAPDFRVSPLRSSRLCGVNGLWGNLKRGGHGAAEPQPKNPDGHGHKKRTKRKKEGVRFLRIFAFFVAKLPRKISLRHPRIPRDCSVED
jgi:hypothetical protein